MTTAFYVRPARPARIGGYDLLPPADFEPTGPVDHGDWNYQPVLGWISRRRLALSTPLLPQNLNRLLKVGYGSGIHMPHWAQHCQELYGIDPHPYAERVAATLANYGVQAHLTSGSAEAMPYANGHFDCVLVISALEFIPDLDAAVREFRRVLRPGGRLVVVTPGRSPVVDAGLRLLTGESAKRDFGDRRESIIPTLERHFTVASRTVFPRVVSRWVCLYEALALEAR